MCPASLQKTLGLSLFFSFSFCPLVSRLLLFSPHPSVIRSPYCSVSASLPLYFSPGVKVPRSHSVSFSAYQVQLFLWLSVFPATVSLPLSFPPSVSIPVSTPPSPALLPKSHQGNRAGTLNPGSSGEPAPAREGAADPAGAACGLRGGSRRASALPARPNPRPPLFPAGTGPSPPAQKGVRLSRSPRAGGKFSPMVKL